MGKFRNSDFDGTEFAVRCYESHPVMNIGNGVLAGGSASWPKVRNADIYVALQSGSTSGLASNPWDAQQVIEVRYTIDDQHAPKDVKRFRAMIDWICKQLQDCKHVHVGCVGGHGRTGMVLAAVVAQLLGEKNAIQYVRKHYCDRAVESHAQIDFLRREYGVSNTAPSHHVTERKLIPPGIRLPGVARLLPGFVPEPAPRLVTRKKAPTVEDTMPEAQRKTQKSFVPMASGTRSLWKPKA